MLRSLSVVVGLAVGALVLPVGPSVAAPTMPAQTLLGESNAVEQVQWRYCRRWNRECRHRWGGGYRYRRCMRRHGC
jgi:hypothetical protein